MQVVWGRDDDGIRKLWALKNVFPSRESVLLFDVVCLRIAFVTDLYGLRHTNDVELVGIGQRVVAVDIATVTCTEGDGRDRFACFGALGRGKV